MNNNKQETHICKWCGAETSQSDDKCYAKPKSSIEWFAERIKSDKIFSFEKVLEQAKAMHKEEHLKTYNQGLMSNFQDFYGYYIETFEGNDESKN